MRKQKSEYFTSVLQHKQGKLCRKLKYILLCILASTPPERSDSLIRIHKKIEKDTFRN